ncbi:hypothetical protein ABZR19_32770 [Pseudomonas aeruginosa]
MTESKICTCPSGDGSLRWPCPAHPAEQAGGDERAAFERAFTVQEGIYFDDKRGEYRSMNLRAIEATDAQDLNLRLQGWQARAALAQPSPVHELDPLGLAPHAEAFNEAPDEALRPEQAEAERPEGPTEDELEAAGLGYPLHKEEAVKLWYSGFRSEVITVLEAWEAIGHDIGMNPDKGELLDSLRYMLEKCEAHDAALARVAELERQQPVAWMHDQPNRVDVIHRDVKDLLQRVPGSSRGIYRPLDVSEHYTIPLYAAPVAQAQHSVPEGWKLVPVEPTEDVLEAIHNGGYVGDDQELRWFYQSILAAAPAPGGE